jgi:hypothetical protein
MNQSFFDAETIAKRFVDRPGYRFITYRGVGIAVFSMNIRILCFVSKGIPPIHEFIMKTMSQGIKSLKLISDILGLDKDIVRSCLIDLRTEELIEVLNDNGSDDVECILTEKGKTVATTLYQDTMEEITIPNVIFHGLLRIPVDLGEYARAQYYKPIEAKELGVDLMRAIPNRSPYPEEIDIPKLDKIIKRTYHTKKENERNVIAVKSILKNVRTLYEPAVMIEYETIDNKRERLVSFIVGGQLKDDYESAFIKAQGPELFSDLLTLKEKTIESRLKEQASKTVIQRLGRLDDVEILAAKVMSSQQEVKDKQQQLEKLDRVDTKEKQKKQIEELKNDLEIAEKKLIEAEKERNARKVKYLWTPEIREKLWETIKTAKQRVLLLSGWISSEVINDVMAAEIRSALKRGVKFWIGYGFDKDRRRGKEQREQPQWKQAEATLIQIQKEFPNQFVFVDIGWSHEKRLICDNRFTFGGSFNLLSFSGEPRTGSRLRHEGTDLIEDSEFCEDRWNYYLKLFFKDQ